MNAILCFGGPRDGEWREVEGGYLIVSRIKRMNGGIGSQHWTEVPAATAPIEYEDGLYEVEQHPLEPCQVLMWKGWSGDRL